jgi:hypothetical protein
MARKSDKLVIRIEPELREDMARAARRADR